ncbi:MAG: hypothetical protein H6672_03330 [Anaerolineaceae bacterium]|nr:hypothetical protein [Anaerolineaceae bacterium]
MQSLLSKFHRLDALLLAVSVGITLLYIATAHGGFPLDDSWIHQVYGRNLALNGEWAFIPGEPSAASTSPLYTVLLAVGYKLGVDYRLWTHALGVLALWITAMIGSRLAARLLPGVRGIHLMAGLALALAWHLAWAAASGMETMLFSMWTLAVIFLAFSPVFSPLPEGEGLGVRARRGLSFRSGAAFGLVGALATLTRPEGAILTGIAGVLVVTNAVYQIVGTHRRAPLSMQAVGEGLRSSQNTIGWCELIRWCIGVAVGFAVLITPYFILNLSLAGGLLPDTAAAKQAENAPALALPFLERVWVLVKPLLAGGQVLLLPGMVAFGVMVGRNMSRKPTVGEGLRPAPTGNNLVFVGLILLLWPLALIALYAARLPAPYQHGRYVIPALPALIVAGVVGVMGLIQAGKRTLAGRVLSRSLAIAAALAFIYFALLAGPGVYRQDVAIIDQEMVAAAHWIAAELPPDELLAVHDIGAVGYFAPRPILDLAGLISPEVVPFILDPPELWAWLEANGAHYLLAFPNQIPGGDVNDPHLCQPATWTSGGPASPAAGGKNMAIYRLAWADCLPAAP